MMNKFMVYFQLTLALSFIFYCLLFTCIMMMYFAIYIILGIIFTVHEVKKYNALQELHTLEKPLAIILLTLSWSLLLLLRIFK